MAEPARKKIKKPHDLLTEVVIVNKKTVSYRNVSREFQIHVNDAKRMMQDFYDKEKRSDNNSVYAVWIISGTKRSGQSDARDFKSAGKQKNVDNETNGHSREATPQNSNVNDDDVVMPSSPPPPPSSLPATQTQDHETWMFPKREDPVVARKTILMCREEQLEAAKDKFETIDSMHIHTLGPQRIRDWVMVSETGRALFRDYHTNHDPLVYNKIYGTIQNDKVWRRTNRRPENIRMPDAKPQPPVQLKVEPKQQEPKSAIAAVKSEMNSAASTSSRPGSRDSSVKPRLKKESSNLMKAFAKQSAAPKTTHTESGNNDTHMSGMDDNDEGEDDDSMFLDADPATKKRAADIQREKEERKAKLQKMMDDEGAEAEVPKVTETTEMDVDPPAAKVGEDADAPDGDVDWSDSDAEQKTKSDAQGPKRRRGKRKVMKKKTVKDDEGFLVTREEEVWESFSEDEPTSNPVTKPLPKPAAKPAASAKAPQKGTIKGAAAGAGAASGKKKDIMSFFQKKT